MNKFKTWLLNEMALNTGINMGGLSRESEFTSLEIPTSEFSIQIINNYSSQHYNIYKYGSTFYLASKDNNYLGYLEVSPFSSTKGQIGASHSILKGGFYNLMFSAVLAYTEFNEIFSDTSLSSQAINSYENLNNKSHLKIRVYTSSGYTEFSKDILLNDVNNIVSISESFNLKEYYNKYPRKNTYDEALFESMNPAFDEKLFCEAIGAYNCSTKHLEDLKYFK